MTNAKSDKKKAKAKQPHGSHDDKPHARKPYGSPYYDPDYERTPDYVHELPDNPRYPERRIYGDYASKNPPPYLPHPFEHTCFKPRKEDYKPPAT